MKINTDGFFCIGKTHKVNQDYVLTNDRNHDGTLVGEPFIIVCDGCSTAPKSDFGSRLLALAAKVNSDVYSFDSELELFKDGVLSKAYDCCNSLGLQPISLSSTLLVAKVEKQNILATIIGDGVLVHKTKAGILRIIETKFPSGAPYYLKYEYSDKELQSYLLQFGNKMEIISTEYNGDKVEKTVTNCEIGQERKIWSFGLEETQFIALMSDGASSFLKTVRTPTSVCTEGVETNDTVKRLVGFKNFHGEFVQRGVKRALEDMYKEELHNMDDLSVAAISVV